jgi:hypothetical protein
MEDEKEISLKEKRIRKITRLYYSNPEIQKALFEFSKNREVIPRYFEGFGKRPDSWQYPSDMFELVKKGATSFHCSQELWDNPLNLSNNQTQEQLNQMRIGWDFLIDIDCPWIEGSKYAAIAIINVLKKFNINSISVKFSGSKGFHILIPSKAFPKEIGGEETKNLFPELPRKLINYLKFETRKELEKIIPKDFLESILKNSEVKRGVQCNSCNGIAEEYLYLEIFCDKCKIGEERKMPFKNEIEIKCPNCFKPYKIKKSIPFYFCKNCNIDSMKKPSNFSNTIMADLFEVMGLDLVLVSPRHLFRMPYSLHEKTALSSVVIDKERLKDFDLKDANPMNIKIKNFMPDNIKEGEAKEFVIKALDWDSENNKKKDEKKSEKRFKEVEIKDISENNFPPCIKKILQGINDGKKRGLFALINFFKMINLEDEEIEKKIYSWNEKNNPKLSQGYLKSQISWALKNKKIMPPNCKEFYQAIGVCIPDEICNKIKNPINYVIIKNSNNQKPKSKIQRKKDLK